jgi:cysteine desulfurase
MRRIYLDYNATTPIAPSVVEAMQPFFAQHFGNPSSTHSLGRATQQAIEDARAEVAELLGAWPDEIVFTSGGSESNNLALKGTLLRDADFGRNHLIISAIEHPAIAQPAEYLRKLGCQVSVCPCDAHGVVLASDVAALIQTNTALVSIMHANNEVGTVQPIREISNLCRQHGVPLHTDAAQSTGKITTHVNELGVDLLTVAGHKLYAPKGIGVLYIRRGVKLEPLIHGAGHEQGMRAGTENIPYIVGMGAASRLARRSLAETSKRLAELRDQLRTTLRESVGPHLIVHGDGAELLPNTLSVNFPDVHGHELLSRIPELCASTGAACHSGDSALSATLAAMGLVADQTCGTVRLSVGWQTSKDEIEKAASLLIDAWEALRR